MLGLPPSGCHVRLGIWTGRIVSGGISGLDGSFKLPILGIDSSCQNGHLKMAAPFNRSECSYF